MCFDYVNDSMIPNKYDTLERNIQIGENEFCLLTIRDVNKLLNDISPEEFNKDERLPYWAELWPSAIALADYLSELDLKNKSILELGCGLGLVGIAAAHYGARVLMTDYEDDALLFAKTNIFKNIQQDLVSSNVQTGLLDWRNYCLNEKFDIILGSDILYERNIHSTILNFIENNLNIHGVALLSDPNRSTLGNYQTNAVKRGFALQCKERKVSWNEKEINIKILSLKK